jgi:hypothetical protein
MGVCAGLTQQAEGCPVYRSPVPEGGFFLHTPRKNLDKLVVILGQDRMTQAD